MTGSPTEVRHGTSLLSDDDLFLFNQGSHFALWEKLGAHPMTVGGEAGTCFAVWAPDAEAVSVSGDFNGWSKDAHGLAPRGSSGIWEGFIPGIGRGALYKYHLRSRFNGYRVDKADPFGFHHEIPPKTGSVVWDLGYAWGDAAWMEGRGGRMPPRRPDVRLRAAPRVVDAGAGGGQPFAHLPRARARGSPSTPSGPGSRTSSSCR